MWMLQYGRLIQQKSCEYHCLHNNVLLESLVITLTVVACLAIAVQTLVHLDFITVPKSAIVANTSSDTRGNQTLKLNQSHVNFTEEFLLEDEDVLDIMEQVVSCTVYTIAAVFVLEIVAKAITLQKLWITSCWQIFDAFVVLANAGVQIALNFLSVSTVIDSASFVIILRLWRIPFVCHMKASQVRQQLEQDVELYRSGKDKADERCDRLENELAVKKEKLRKLEEMLRNKTGKETEMNTNFLPPMMGMTYLYSTMNSDMVDGTGIVKESELQNENLTNHHRANHLGNGNSFRTRQNDPRKAKYASLGIFPGSLPRSEELYDITSFIECSSLCGSSPQKQYRRNLSTSDFMAYSALSSPERQISISDSDKLKELSNSCPCLDIHGEDLGTELKSEDHQVEVEGNNQSDKQPSMASDTSSNSSSATAAAAGCSVNSDEHNSKTRRKVQRYPSCPEYVYTQRMSITSDESLLIGAKHTRFDPSHENFGFLSEDGSHLQVLAEIDGTKIYRSEGGEPMTSL